MSNAQHINTYCLHHKLEHFLLVLLLIHLIFLSIRNTESPRVATGVFAAEEEQLQASNITTEENEYDDDMPRLTLSQIMVSVDYESKEWYEDKRMPHNEWQDSILPVIPFYHNWDGNLVYLHTSCPDTLSTANFPLLNNQTSFPEQMLGENYDDNGLLRRVALISCGDSCSWSTKISHAQSIMDSYNMSLIGIILYDNLPPTTTENNDDGGIENRPENDLSNQPANSEPTSSPILPIIFVNQNIGQILIQTLYYVSNNFTAMSKVLVFYEKLPLDPNDDIDKEEKILEKAQSTDRLILAGQLIVNSVAIILVIILIAYACHRFRRRQQLLAARRMLLNNGQYHPSQPDRNSTTDTSLIESTTSSILATMIRRHGSVQEGHVNDLEEEAGIGWQQLESKFPKINYDPLIIRNSTCAICLDDFRMLRRNNSSKGNGNVEENNRKTTDEKSENIKQLRRLKCGHGFCVSCIDPWLSDKSRKCPLCKRDCTHDSSEGTTRPERIHTGNPATSTSYSMAQCVYHPIQSPL